MLDDREPSVSSLRSIGAELTSHVDEVEKQQVEGQLTDLIQRWEKLSEFAEARQHTLEAAAQVSY